MIKKKSPIMGKKIHRKCDRMIDCNKKGEFRAPKSRLLLNEYYFFCIEHIKEYNKSWDFYKGLNVNQIENSMRDDVIWNRPSWPLKGNPYKIIEQINTYFSENLEEFADDKNSKNILEINFGRTINNGRKPSFIKSEFKTSSFLRKN